MVIERAVIGALTVTAPPVPANRASSGVMPSWPRLFKTASTSSAARYQALFGVNVSVFQLPAPPLPTLLGEVPVLLATFLSGSQLTVSPRTPGDASAAATAAAQTVH